MVHIHSSMEARHVEIPLLLPVSFVTSIGFAESNIIFSANLNLGLLIPTLLD